MLGSVQAAFRLVQSCPLVPPAETSFPDGTKQDDTPRRGHTEVGNLFVFTIHIDRDREA
jgi:hypothetical protein